MSKSGMTGFGIFLGAVAGYPISYFFQPAIFRAKVPMGDYIQHIGDVLRAGDSTAIGVWIGSVVVFGLLGMLIGAASGNKP